MGCWVSLLNFSSWWMWARESKEKDQLLVPWEKARVGKSSHWAASVPSSPPPPTPAFWHIMDLLFGWPPLYSCPISPENHVYHKMRADWNKCQCYWRNVTLFITPYNWVRNRHSKDRVITLGMRFSSIRNPPYLNKIITYFEFFPNLRNVNTVAFPFYFTSLPTYKLLYDILCYWW